MFVPIKEDREYIKRLLRIMLKIGGKKLDHFYSTQPVTWLSWSPFHNVNCGLANSHDGVECPGTPYLNDPGDGP